MNLCIVITVAIFAALVAFLYSKKKSNPTIEKYWKYLIILLPALFILTLIIINVIFKKGIGSGTGSIDPTKSDFLNKLDDIKGNLQEAKTVADLKTQYIQQDRQADLDKLNQITAIDDKTERRQQLVALGG